MGAERISRIKRGTEVISFFTICVLELSKEGFAR
jgi:hypothetical protein